MSSTKLINYTLQRKQLRLLGKLHGRRGKEICPVRCRFVTATGTERQGRRVRKRVPRPPKPPAPPRPLGGGVPKSLKPSRCNRREIQPNRAGVSGGGCVTLTWSCRPCAFKINIWKLHFFQLTGPLQTVNKTRKPVSRVRKHSKTTLLE